MAMGSVLLALAMVAADGPSCPPVETMTYQVRVLTLDGLDWRTSSYSRLQPVAHQGTSTIWTADRALAASLLDRAKGSSPCHTIMAVGEAVMTKADAVNYIAAVGRVADGPVNQSSAIAFVPRPEQLEERFSIKVEGRKLDQGILTKMVLEETHVDVIHGVPQTETLVPPAAKGSKNALQLGQEVRDFILTAIPSIPQSTSITSSVQIPEVTRASVAGEWLIPNDGVLIVSLGVKTAADEKGMAVVRERVAIIEACAEGSTGPDGKRSMITTASTGPFQHVKLGQPVVPGRSMPEAIDPNGNVVDLPPLPEALASADLDRIKPEPFQPTPQAPIQSAPSADPALAKTSYDAAPPAPKAPMYFTLGEIKSRSIVRKKTVEALAKAGVDAVEVDFEIKDGSKGENETFDFELQDEDVKLLWALRAAGLALDTPGQCDANHVVIAPKELAGMKLGSQKCELCESKDGQAPKSMPTVAGPVGGDININLEPSDLAVAVLKAGDDVEWGDVIVAMIKAGVKFDKAPFLNSSSFIPAKVACEKCDGDTTFCPANAPTFKAEQVAGGIRLVPDTFPDSLRSGMNLESLSEQVRDLARFLDSKENKDVVLKLLGRTETTVLPVNGQFSLELKATVVPASPEKDKVATKKGEAPTPRY
jgi:hypothetical protein